MRAADVQGCPVHIPRGTILRGAPGGGGLRRPLATGATGTIRSLGIYGNAVREIGISDIPGIGATVYANLADCKILDGPEAA